MTIELDIFETANLINALGMAMEVGENSIKDNCKNIDIISHYTNMIVEMSRLSLRLETEFNNHKNRQS